MDKKTFPFEFVIHRDDDGTVRATVAWRTIWYDDDGSIIKSEVTDAKTLDQAGAEFAPLVGKFCEEVHLEALTGIEAERARAAQLAGELAAAQQRVADTEKRLEAAVATVADREALINAVNRDLYAFARSVNAEVRARTTPAEASATAAAADGLEPPAAGQK